MRKKLPTVALQSGAKRAAVAANAKPLPKHTATTDKIEHMEAQPRRSHKAQISEYKEIKTLADVSPDAVIELQEWQKTRKPGLTWQDTPIGKGFALLSVIKNGR